MPRWCVSEGEGLGWAVECVTSSSDAACMRAVQYSVGIYCTVGCSTSTVPGGVCVNSVCMCVHTLCMHVVCVLCVQLQFTV